MKSPLYWSLIAAVAVWQIELAVHAGIAASRRPAKPQIKSSAPVCTGPSCPPSQLTPQRVIVQPR